MRRGITLLVLSLMAYGLYWARDIYTVAFVLIFNVVLALLADVILGTIAAEQARRRNERILSRWGEPAPRSVAREKFRELRNSVPVSRDELLCAKPIIAKQVNGALTDGGRAEDHE
jgi:hypothetical protein